MAKFDIAKLNAAVDKLLEATDNPRHRFLLQAFGRHRHLEVSGRYEEICAPDMMVTDPVYHFHYTGLEFELRGQDQVKGLYRMWAETNQIFFPSTRRWRWRTTSLLPRHCVPAGLGKGRGGRRTVLSSRRCCRQVAEEGTRKESAPRGQ